MTGKGTRRTAIGAETADTTKVFDKYLQRVSHISQAGLLVLALFGYIYTVKPLYSKAVLEEDIAKKQLEIKNKDNKLIVIDKNLQQKNNQLMTLNSQIESSKQEASEANLKYKKSLNQLTAMKSESAAMQRVIESRNNELETAKTTSLKYCNKNKELAMEAIQVNSIFSCTAPLLGWPDESKKYDNPSDCIMMVSNQKNIQMLLKDVDRTKLNGITSKIYVQAQEKTRNIQIMASSNYNKYNRRLEDIRSEFQGKSDIQSKFAMSNKEIEAMRTFNLEGSRIFSEYQNLISEMTHYIKNNFIERGNELEGMGPVMNKMITSGGSEPETV